MRENEQRIGKKDLEKQEFLQLRTGVVAISGRSGTGKTNLAENLAKAAGIPAERNIKTGQKFREIGLLRPSDVDREMDSFQRTIIRNASLENPVILEGRLAPVIVAEERVNNPNLPIVTILIKASFETRMKRIQHRLIKEQWEKPGGRELPPKEFRSIYLGAIEKEEKEREEVDRLRWETLYPQLKGIDPFDPDNRDINGKLIYDLVIDTDDKSPKETFYQTLEQLAEVGAVHRPQNEAIFYT